MAAVFPLRRATNPRGSAQGDVDKTITAEIGIALCGPMGTPLHSVAETFQKLLRERDASVLAQMAIQKITLARAALRMRQQEGQSDFFADPPGAVIPACSERHCHILDSIKNVEELRLLRSVHGDMLHVVRVYTPIEQRIQQLSRKNKPEVIQRLIDRDSGEEMDDGQRVLDTSQQVLIIHAGGIRTSFSSVPRRNSAKLQTERTRTLSRVDLQT